MSKAPWVSQARRLFELLDEAAEVDDHGERVFTGKLGDLFNQTGASNASYSKILGLLKAYEVIRIAQRGNRYQPSVIFITGKLPEGDLLPPEHLTEARSAATMAVAAEIRAAVVKLTAWRESLEKGGLDLAEVVRNYERRISLLEREVNDLRGKATKKATEKSARQH